MFDLQAVRKRREFDTPGGDDSGSRLDALRNRLARLAASLARFSEDGDPPPFDSGDPEDGWWEDENHLYLSIRLPGRSGNDVDITYHGNLCFIRIER